MKNNKTHHDIKPDAEGTNFWFDNYTRYTMNWDGNFILDGVDAPEAKDVLLMWEDFHIDWAFVGPHRFKAGDRIIQFNCSEEEQKPGPTVQAIEVIEVGPSEIRIPYFDFSHFIAYRKLKGYAPVELSPDHVVELRAQGLIMGFADLQHCKKLSQEEWDKFVRTLKLRQGQAEPKKQPEGQTR